MKRQGLSERIRRTWTAVRRALLLTRHAATDGNYAIVHGMAFRLDRDCQCAELVQVSEELTGKVVVPAFCRGLRVRAIGNFAFAGCVKVTSIVVPEGVTSMGVETFFACFRLRTVSLPESLVEVGGDLFEGARETYTDALGIRYEGPEKRYLISAPETLAGDFVVPESVRFINAHAFSGCTGLTRLQLPSGLRVLGNDICEGCPALTEVVFTSPPPSKAIQSETRAIPKNG